MQRDNRDELRHELIAELESEKRRSYKLGRSNYLASYWMYATGLLASITAGALGLFSDVPGWVIGIVALVPAAATLLGRQLKLQQKANHYYLLESELDTILGRARYSEKPEDGTGSLSEQAREAKRKALYRWQQNLAFDVDTATAQIDRKTPAAEPE